MGVIFHLQFSEKYTTHSRLVLKVWDLVPSLPPMHCNVVIVPIERNLGWRYSKIDGCTQRNMMTHTSE